LEFGVGTVIKNILSNQISMVVSIYFGADTSNVSVMQEEKVNVLAIQYKNNHVSLAKKHECFIIFETVALNCFPWIQLF